MITNSTTSSLVFLTLILFSGASSAVPIAFNDFFADPSVDVSADGSSAFMGEDAGLSSVILEYNPRFDGPEILLPLNGSTLTFSYEFLLGQFDTDLFRVNVFDAFTYDTLSTFVADTTSSGTTSFDLSSFRGSTLGLQFELRRLNPFNGFMDSTVSIFDVAYEIPEPPVLVLFSSALLFLFGSKRRKRVV